MSQARIAPGTSTVVPVEGAGLDGDVQLRLLPEGEKQPRVKALAGAKTKGQYLAGRQVEQSDKWNELNLLLGRNRPTGRDAATLSQIKAIRDLDPQASLAVWNFLRLLNPGHDLKAVTIDRNGEEKEESGPAQAYLDGLALRVGQEYGGGLDQFHNVLALMLVTNGAICAEIAPNEALDDVEDWYAVDPTLITFKRLEVVDGKGVDADAVGAAKDKAKSKKRAASPWDPSFAPEPLVEATQAVWWKLTLGQLFRDGTWHELPSDTVVYQPLDPDVDDPYGRPPLLSAVAQVISIARMLNDLRAVVHNQGYPRINVTVVADAVRKAAPVHLQDPTRDKELTKWVNDQVGLLISDYEALQVDDTFIHFDWVQVDTVGGASTMNFQGLEQILSRRLNVSLKMLPILQGSMEGTTETHGCYSDDTEALTRRGWVRHDGLTLDDEVACFDLDSRSLRWERPTKVWAYDHDGDMVRIKGRSLDMLVTPNHRMVVQPATGIERPFEFRTAEQLESVYARDGGLSGSPWRLPYASPFQHGRSTESASPAFARLLGWWLSEGSLDRHGVRLTQAVGAKADAMVAAATEAGYEPTVRIEHWREAEQPVAQVRLKASGDLRAWLIRESGDHSWNKHIPSVVWDWPIERKADLLDALIEGDGSRPAEDRLSYSSASQALADDVQRLAIELGYSASVSRYSRDNGWRDQHVVWIGTRGVVEVRPDRHFERVEYTGKVYCLTVPTGAYLTRRNGRMAIAGNSIQWQIQVLTIQALQRLIKRTIERLANISLQLAGFACQARLHYEELRSVDRILEANADFVESQTKQFQVLNGWIKNDEAAENLIGHKAVGENQSLKLLTGQADAAVAAAKAAANPPPPPAAAPAAPAADMSLEDAAAALATGTNLDSQVPGGLPPADQAMKVLTGKDKKNLLAMMLLQKTIQEGRVPVTVPMAQRLAAETRFVTKQDVNAVAERYGKAVKSLFLKSRLTVMSSMRFNGFGLGEVMGEARDVGADIADEAFGLAFRREVKGLLRQAMREGATSAGFDGDVRESALERIWRTNTQYVDRIRNDLRDAIRDGSVNSPESLASWFGDNAYREDLMGRFVARQGFFAGYTYGVEQTVEGSVVYEWIMGDAKHCESCLERSGEQYTYEELQVVGFPGSINLDCASNCHCVLEERRIADFSAAEGAVNTGEGTDWSALAAIATGAGIGTLAGLAVNEWLQTPTGGDEQPVSEVSEYDLTAIEEAIDLDSEGVDLDQVQDYVIDQQDLGETVDADLAEEFSDKPYEEPDPNAVADDTYTWSTPVPKPTPKPAPTVPPKPVPVPLKKKITTSPDPLLAELEAFRASVRGHE